MRNNNLEKILLVLGTVALASGCTQQVQDTDILSDKPDNYTEAMLEIQGNTSKEEAGKVRSILDSRFSSTDATVRMVNRDDFDIEISLYLEPEEARPLIQSYSEEGNFSVYLPVPYEENFSIKGESYAFEEREEGVAVNGNENTGDFEVGGNKFRTEDISGEKVLMVESYSAEEIMEVQDLRLRKSPTGSFSGSLNILLDEEAAKRTYSILQNYDIEEKSNTRYLVFEGEPLEMRQYADGEMLNSVRVSAIMKDRPVQNTVINFEAENRSAIKKKSELIKTKIRSGKLPRKISIDEMQVKKTEGK